MKKFTIYLAALALILSVFAQERSHDVAVINVEVTAMVYEGNSFVDSLTIDDFEVLEDGTPQPLSAVYLVKKTKIQRKEERKPFAPITARHFYLVFEISKYSPKLKKAVEYFVQNVLVPRDSLTLVTPSKTYRMKNRTLEVLPRPELVRQFDAILRRDALSGNAEYISLLDEIKDSVKVLSGALSGESEVDIFNPVPGYGGTDIDSFITRYSSLLRRLEKIRKVDEEKILEFARILKEQEGQKHVFLFYQREYIPQLKPDVIIRYISLYQNRPDIIHGLSYLFDFVHRDLSFDVQRVKQALSNSSIAIHFLFFTEPAKPVPGIRMKESSEDVYLAFSEMADATGGLVDSSANPTFLFQRSSEASQNYYLLYYNPKDYKPDGKFKRIEVKVKNKKYRIIHREGYFAR